MMNPLDEILSAYPIVVLDGALATELERRGADLNDPLWSAKILLHEPELIYQVHLDYFRAGADVATTATYQATIPGLVRRGLTHEQAVRVLRQAVELAANARDAFWADPRNRVDRPRPLVAASIGPYGAFLHDGSEYRGDYALAEAELATFHRERMQVLAGSGADMLACETIPCLMEARVLSELLAEFPDMTAWFTFTARDGRHISHGEEIGECAEFLEKNPQVAAIGVNCSSPLYITGLIREIRARTDKEIIVYPNSGEVYDAANNRWLGETSCDAFGAQAREWYSAGARIIGGCCRTTPDHIRELAALAPRAVT
jgi:homocysteine S-methyltransferase